MNPISSALVIAGERASSPRRGRSLSGSVAPLARQMLAAVAHIRRNLPKGDCVWLETAAKRDQQHDHLDLRRAWSVAAIGVLHGLRSPGEPVRLADALSWFGDPGSADAWRPIRCVAAESAITAICASDTAADLFPYILDGFGPTSRLDVIRDSSRAGDRSARKDIGSFYTPSDVADFMVSSIAGSDPESAAWLDPACGSGVFLCAVLRILEAKRVRSDRLIKFATSQLFGMDISQLAADFAAFSIVQRLLVHSRKYPRLIWSAVRRNIVALNSLKVVARAGSPGDARSLTGVFGEIDRPLRIVCNPPYAAVGGSEFSRCWDSLAGGSAASALYLPFVEMAWRFDGREGDGAAFVVPLAFATNGSSDHVKCRSALTSGGGHWTMLFFDRQPSALFGEDVKTRNTILFRRQSVGFRIKTSRLLKWTGTQRPSIFSEGRAIELDDLSIDKLIPKIGSIDEAGLYTALTSYRLKSPERPTLSSASAREIASIATSSDVFVAGTAYNFLNVFRDYPDEKAVGGKFSDSKVHRLRFSSAENAEAAYAIISSRAAFWLWHVQCDGFHVPAWFLDDLPLFDLPLAPQTAAELSGLGRKMWLHAKRNLLASQNGGKWTFSFRPTDSSLERHRADALILEAAGASVGLNETLLAFEEAIVSVDGRTRLARSGEFEKIIQGLIKR